jgi:hypothetical protein
MPSRVPSLVRLWDESPGTLYSVSRNPKWPSPDAISRDSLPSVLWRSRSLPLNFFRNYGQFQISDPLTFRHHHP